MNNKNPIMAVVRDILQNLDTSISEYELLKQVKVRAPAFSALLHENHKLALFQHHFIIMNALYQLQQKLLSENLYLSITVTDIRLEKTDPEAGRALVSKPDEQKLRDYYLDWSNLAETSLADVEKLLTSFWKTYIAQDQRVEALQQLELPVNASWEMVKQQYRRMVGLHHPDKDGDANEFKRIRQAYEILQRCQFG